MWIYTSQYPPLMTFRRCASRGRQRCQGVVVVALEGSMAHRPIPSSLSSATELEVEVARERGLKGDPAEPYSALEEEAALGHGGTDKGRQRRQVIAVVASARKEAGLGEPRLTDPRIAAAPGAASEHPRRSSPDAAGAGATTDRSHRRLSIWIWRVSWSIC
jgi:hypothetical protein